MARVARVWFGRDAGDAVKPVNVIVYADVLRPQTARERRLHAEQLVRHAVTPAPRPRRAWFAFAMAFLTGMLTGELVLAWLYLFFEAMR